MVAANRKARALLKRFNAGESAVGEELVQTFDAALRPGIAKQLGARRRTQVEDVLHDTMAWVLEGTRSGELKFGVRALPIHRALHYANGLVALLRQSGRERTGQASHLARLKSAEPAPETGAAQETLRSRVNNVLRTLAYREREIIKGRYGLGDGFSPTIAEVDGVFRATRERIQAIESRAQKRGTPDVTPKSSRH